MKGYQRVKEKKEDTITTDTLQNKSLYFTDERASKGIPK